MSRKRLRVLTWHVHGNYLYYLSQAPHEFFIVTKPHDPPGYAGRVGHLPWGDNVHEVPAECVRDTAFDCVLYQHQKHYEHDRLRLLSDDQRALPTLFVEHDPPRGHPTDTLHPVQDPNVLLVHVTPFNALMWDNGVTPTRVIEHGVLMPDHVAYHGTLPKGVTVVNNLARRGVAWAPTCSRPRVTACHSNWSGWGFGRAGRDRRGAEPGAAELPVALPVLLQSDPLYEPQPR